MRTGFTGLDLPLSVVLLLSLLFSYFTLFSLLHSSLSFHLLNRSLVLTALSYSDVAVHYSLAGRWSDLRVPYSVDPGKMDGFVQDMAEEVEKGHVVLEWPGGRVERSWGKWEGCVYVKRIVDVNGEAGKLLVGVCT